MLNYKNENKRVWEHQYLPFGDHPINEFGVENQESMDCLLVLAIFIKSIKRLFWEFIFNSTNLKLVETLLGLKIWTKQLL